MQLKAADRVVEARPEADRLRADAAAKADVEARAVAAARADVEAREVAAVKVDAEARADEEVAEDDNRANPNPIASSPNPKPNRFPMRCKRATNRCDPSAI